MGPWSTIELSNGDRLKEYSSYYDTVGMLS